MSKATEESLRASRKTRAQIKQGNENKRASFGGFGRGSTSGSTYHKSGLKKRSAYGSNSYND